jgi:sec-independent protein translocase protein TatC
MVFPADASFLANPFAFYNPLIALVLKQILRDVLPPSVQLIAGELTAPLEIYLIGSFILGLAVSTPIIAYEAYRYVDPALYPDERRVTYPFIASFTGLFIVGAAFGYRILAPFMVWAMVPFFNIAGATPLINAMDFYNLVFVTTLATGFSFTLPVFFVLLVRFGIVRTSFVTTRRRYIYAAMYIITAVITPDGGPLADVALFIPMVLLLELAVLFGKRYEKKGVVYRLDRAKPVYTKCRYCGGLLGSREAFCPTCGKAQA